MKVWFNGNITDDAKISLQTHALNYGTSVFEGIRFFETSKGPAIFRVKDHIDRLFLSAESLGMNVPYSRNDIYKAIVDVVKGSSLKEGYIRPLFFYGDESINVYPEQVSVNCAVFVSEYNQGREDLRVHVSNIRKVSEKSTIPGTKFGGFYVNSILAMEDARKNGFDEALLLDEKGNVSEGPLHNFFVVKDKLVITPVSSSILLGITRDTVLTISKDCGFESIEKELSVEEMNDSDEAFFCGTAAGIKWIKEIDHIKFGDEIGSVTSKLKEKYEEIITGADDKYKDWLEII